ncbi:MAG: hypothetical protein AB1439_06445 [candidate division FCPU426 bacterium]
MPEKSPARAGSFAVAACLAGALLLTGCAPRLALREDNAAARSAVARLLAAARLVCENDPERALVEKSVYEMVYYLEARYGAKSLAAWLAQVESGRTPGRAAVEVYRKSLYQLGAEAIHALTRDRTRTAGPLLPHAAGDYEVFFDETSVVSGAYPYIERQLLRYADGLRQYLAESPHLREKYEAARERLFREKVLVFLLDDFPRIKEYFGDSPAIAQTSIGYRMDESTRTFRLYAQMSFRYAGALSLATLTHEMTHVIYILARLTPEQLQAYPADEPGIIQKLKSLISRLELTGGGLLGEGLAEYLSAEQNLLYRCGLLDDVDDDLRASLSLRPLQLDGREWQKWIDSRDTDQRVLAYQLAHSWSRYLIRRFGKSRFMELTGTAARDADFQRVLGQNQETLLGEWMQTLQGRPGDR